MFLEVYGFLLHAKYVRSPYLRNVCVFPKIFYTMEDFSPHILGIVWISKHVKYIRNPWIWNVYIFPYVFRTIEICFPHVLGTKLLLWKWIKDFYFHSHFQSGVYVKLFTKEVDLFCRLVQSNICIWDPFAIEVWKYIQYRIADSVFHSTASVFGVFLWKWMLQFV